MSTPSGYAGTVDPDATIPIEAVAATPMGFAVAMWQQAEPAPRPEQWRLDRVPALLAATAALTGQPTEDFARALAAGDPRARGALIRLEYATGTAVDALRQRCVRWRAEGEWAALRHESELYGYLAESLGDDVRLCEAWLLLAAARRGLGDARGTIDAYQMVIELAGRLGDERALAVAYDNLGNVLAGIGDLDEALACYAKAGYHEREPAGQLAIAVNRANAYMVLGELHAAYTILKAAEGQLRHSGVQAAQLAIYLDNLATAHIQLGAAGEARELLDRALDVMGANELAARAVNRLIYAEACGQLDDDDGRRTAFLAAYDLALREARQKRDIARYREGYAAARRHAVPDDDEAHALFAQAISARMAEAWGAALELFQRSAGRARSAGDEALELRAAANIVALLADAGQLDQALGLAMQIRHRASEAGLAAVEGMIIGTLVSLANRGVDTGEPMRAVGLIATAEVIDGIHRQVVAGSGVDEPERIFQTQDAGTLDAQAGKVAERYHADAFAAERYRRAAGKARDQGLRFELINRLCGLTLALSRLGDEAGVAQAVAELRPLLDAPDVPLRGQIVGWRALAARVGDADPREAAAFLRRAVAAAEQLRQRAAPGPGRVAVTAEMRTIHYFLAETLRRTGAYEEAFDALQRIKARRILDLVLARHGQGDGPRPQPQAALDTPATLAEVRPLLARLSQDRRTVLVDLVAERDGVTAYLVDVDGVQVVRVAGSPLDLARGGAADVREREIRMVRACTGDPLLRSLVARIAQAAREDARILLVPDGYLHNMPLHIVPLGGRPWCEQMPIGYLPAAAVLRLHDGVQPATGRSLVAGDSRGDLPWAAHEARVVGGLLGTAPLVGPQCTLDAVREALRGDLDVVHLAVHGRADVRRGRRASLLFADGDTGVQWVPLAELAELPWRARLVVLSGCATGVAGAGYDEELASVAQAVVEAGAPRVLATLWPIDDRAAALFMAAFYRELAGPAGKPTTDLLAVMDIAREALRAGHRTASGGMLAASPPSRRRDGRDIQVVPGAPDVAPPHTDDTTDAVLSWAPFVLFGDPAWPAGTSVRRSVSP